MPGQRPDRHHPANGTDHKIHDRAPGEAEQIAHGGDDDVLHRGARDCLLERRREILEHDDGFSARIVQLMGELAGGVEWVDVDCDQAGPHHRGDGDRVLQHVRHHDRDPRALGEAAALQPGGERPGQRVDLAESDGLAHADIGFGVVVLGEAFLDQRHQAGID
jgi:hypothetical protein